MLIPSREDFDIIEIARVFQGRILAGLPMAHKSKHQELPDDTVYNILVRLPVKTLCRFKCTCKSWCSLISSPQFQTDHYRHAQKNPFLLAMHRSSDPFTLHLSTYDSNEGTLVKKFSEEIPYRRRGIVPVPFSGIFPIQSCLGLVCITPAGRVKESNLIIYNPSTDALLLLPPAQGLNICVGFGYAYSTNVFKVVRFFYDGAAGAVFRCGVFTLGTHEWRDARSPPYCIDEGCAPFFNGAIHLLPSRYGNVQKEDHIAAFNIDSEEYKVIRLPEFYFTVDRTVESCLSLSRLGGSLCLSNLDGTRKGEMELWLLKDYHNGEWIKGYTIRLSPLVDLSLTENTVRAHPLAIQGDGSILLNIDIFGDEVLCYDPKERLFTQKIDNDCTTTLYEETFLSLEVCNLMAAH